MTLTWANKTLMYSLDVRHETTEQKICGCLTERTGTLRFP